MSSRTELFGIALVLAAVAGATAHRFQNGLVWDDLYTIERGEVLHDLGRAPELFTHPTLYVSSTYSASDDRPVDTFRPVTLLTFMVDSALTGRDPTAYHSTNLIAHLVCVLLVFLLARRLLPPALGRYATFAAGWFGLSPLLAEAHVWINGRSDVFCALFGLAALLTRCEATREDRSRGARVALHVLAGSLFLLSALSKEAIVLAWPALLSWPTRSASEESVALGPGRRGWAAHLVSLLPFAVATVVYVGMRVLAIGGARATGDGSQFVVAITHTPALLVDGLTQSIAPTRVLVRSLHDDYAAIGPVALGALALMCAGIAVLAHRSRRRTPLVAWSVLWFASTLAPAAVVTTVLWPGFGRYLYLPMAGLAIGGAEIFARIVAKRPRLTRALTICAVAYLVVLGALLAGFTVDFRNDDALWGAVTEREPDAPHGWGYLGIMRSDRGRPVDAIQPLQRAVELAPSEPRYLLALGLAQYRSGDCDATIVVADMGVRRFAPRAGSFHLLPANCLSTSDPRRVATSLLRCLADEPNRADCQAALHEAVHSHPLAASYRATIEELLRTDEFASLAPRVERMMEGS